MPNEHFLESAKACIGNGEHLLENAEFLEYSEHPSTMLALSIIAQEEFAKGFLLVLVARGIIPWDPLIYRAAHNHECKQLLGIVMEHMNPDGDLFLTQLDESMKLTNKSSELLKLLDQANSKEEKDRIWQRIHEIDEFRDGLPATVADAINILRHEKIGRWRSAFEWAMNLEYDPLANRIAKGNLDQEKQDALYVRISRSGEFVSSPMTTMAGKAQDLFERAKRLGQVVKHLVDGDAAGLLDYEKIELAFKTLFAPDGATQIVRKRKEN
jgi:hypothetical protein